MEFDDLIKKITDMESLMRKAATLCEKAPGRVNDYLDRAATLKYTAFCMKEYIEPWSCPDCGHVRKIPVFLKKPGECPKCLNTHMMPYAYLEQKRMDGQLRWILQCITWYSKQPNGQVATRCLKGLAQAGGVNAEKTGLHSP